MSIETLSAPQIRQLLSLLEKKEALQAEIAKVNSELSSIESPKAASPAPVKRRGKAKKATKVTAAAKLPVETPIAEKPEPTAKTKPARKPKAAAKPSKRGGVKEAVLAILEKAGKAGASVVEIAKELAVKPGNVHVWFATTGKKITEITKIAPGKYALKS